MITRELNPDALLPGLRRTNPSIINWGGRRLMSYRRELVPLNCWSHTCICECDWQWQPVKGTSRVLNIPVKLNLCGHRIAEDCRLFLFRNRLMFTVTNRHHIGFGELDANLMVFNFRWLDAPPPQKNWMPFDYEGKRCAVAWTGTQKIIEFGRDFILPLAAQEAWSWSLGEPHGGTPCVRYGDRYVGVIQSHVILPCHGERLYFMAPYTFEDKPPFRVLQTPNDSWLLDRTTLENGWSVQFPCGLVHENDRWLVSWGDDARAYVTEFTQEEFFRHLQPA